MDLNGFETQPFESFDDAYREFDKVKFGLVCRQIEVMAVRKNKSAAIEILKRYLGATDRAYATMESSITDVLEVRAANKLEENGYVTLTLIDKATDQELIDIEDIGQKTVQDIRRTIEQIKAGKILEGIDDPELYFQPTEDSKFEFYNQPILKQEPKNMANAISDAVGILLDAPTDAILEIDDRIEGLQKQIDRLKAVKKLFGGTTAAKSRSVSSKIGTLNREKWGTTIAQIREYIELNGPAKAGVIAESINSSALMVGKLANGVDEFYVNDQKQVCLSF